MPDEFKNLIPLISPIIGALAGVFLVPLVEARKNEASKKELVKNLMLEIEDLSKIAENKALKLYKSRIQLKKFLSNQTNDLILNGLAKIEIYHAHDALTKAYSILSSDEKKAIKALVSNIDMVNKIIGLLLSDNKNLSYLDLVIEHTANIYWLAMKLTTETTFTYDKNHSNEVATNDALNALGIKLI